MYSRATSTMPTSWSSSSATTPGLKGERSQALRCSAATSTFSHGPTGLVNASSFWKVREMPIQGPAERGSLLRDVDVVKKHNSGPSWGARAVR